MGGQSFAQHASMQIRQRPGFEPQWELYLESPPRPTPSPMRGNQRCGCEPTTKEHVLMYAPIAQLARALPSMLRCRFGNDLGSNPSGSYIWNLPPAPPPRP